MLGGKVFEPQIFMYRSSPASREINVNIYSDRGDGGYKNVP